MANDDLTMAEAAALLGRHVSSLWDLTASGRLPSRRVGAIRLLRRADVLAYRARRDGQDAAEPAPAVDEDEVTVKQAADLLGVTVYAVHAAMKRGSLPHRRVGFVYLLRWADVTAFRERRRWRAKPGRPVGSPAPWRRKPPPAAHRTEGEHAV
jgi:excisionase family DNA binding protein